MKRIAIILAVVGSLFGTAAVTAGAASATPVAAAPSSWYHA